MTRKFYKDLTDRQVGQVKNMFDQKISPHPNYFYTYEIGLAESVLSRKSFAEHLHYIYCPPEIYLDRMIEYIGEARYVGIYWESCGDELAWYDGCRRFVGARHHDFLKVARELILFQHKIGGSEEETINWIVCDRKSNTLFWANALLAEFFVQGQWRESGYPPITDLPQNMQDAIKKMMEKP
jgi:hypothetical protein